MKEIQKPIASPRVSLDKAKENVLYRDSIRRYFEYKFPRVSLLAKNVVRRVKETTPLSIGKKRAVKFVFEGA